MASGRDTSGMSNPLVDLLEPSFNGGILVPLLTWASSALPNQLSTSDTPAGVLHRVVSADANRTGPGSLGSEFAGWMSGRLHAHLPYFILSGLLLLAWLLACGGLLCATLHRERRRRARLRRILRDGSGDQVDAAADGDGTRGAKLPRRPQYRLFGAMVVRRMHRLAPHAANSERTDSGDGKREQHRSGLPFEKNRDDNNSRRDIYGADSPDAAEDPWSTSSTVPATTASTTRTTAAEVIRAAHLSTKTLSFRDRRLLIQTGATALAGLLCVSLLIAYCSQAGGIVQLTDSGPNSARSIVSGTVGHLNRFLTRSLVESNRTIIDAFEKAFPDVERLFRNFGTELLDLLMSDYGIEQLIGHLEFFLTAVNGTVNAMRFIKDARDTVIKPLQQFSAKLQVHRDALRDPLSSVCTRFGSLFPPGHCGSLVTRLADLRLAVNDTKLETDSSVAIVTLLNKMMNLDIDNVQKQVQKAKESLSNGLQAISDVIRKLLDGLVDTVSSQFDQAEATLISVKSGFDRAADDPNLWGAVEVANKAVLCLVVFSSLVFVLACAICCLLLWALVRYLRTACRLDNMPSTISTVRVVEQSKSRAIAELSIKSSPLRRASSSSSTSGISSGSFSSPYWSPRFADRDVRAVRVAEDEASFGRFSSRRGKLRRLQDREWNGFLYCCSFDCSLVLIVGALLLLLPLLFGLAFFYATAEVQVEACRYLASSSGNQLWDSRLDEFTKARLWPLVRDALDKRPELPISLPSEPPQRFIQTVRGSCDDANATLFSVFGLTGLLNATALLASNLTQSQFLSGANLVKEQINATDANALIPQELDSVKSVLPQLAKLLDSEDYAASIVELRQPLLVMPRVDVFITDMASVATAALQAEPSNSDAAILRHSVAQLNASMSQSTGLADQLAQLRQQFQLLQDSRNFTSLSTSLLAALNSVQGTLADKPGMLDRVDARFEPCLARHLPLFANYLDPLASGLLASVGHCDDLRLALETLSGSLCSTAVPRANMAAFLLLLTIAFFAALCSLSWWLLVRVGRHQAAVLQFEIEANRYCQSGVDNPAAVEVSDADAVLPDSPETASPQLPPVPPRRHKHRQTRRRYGESQV